MFSSLRWLFFAAHLLYIGHGKKHIKIIKLINKHILDRSMISYCTIWFHIVQYGTILYNMVSYCTIWYHIVQYGIILYYIILYCIILYYIIFRRRLSRLPGSLSRQRQPSRLPGRMLPQVSRVSQVYYIILHYIILYNMVPYCTIWYHIVQYDIILYNMISYYIILILY